MVWFHMAHYRFSDALLLLSVDVVTIVFANVSFCIPKNCLLSLRAATVIDLVTVIVQTVHEMTKLMLSFFIQQS